MSPFNFCPRCAAPLIASTVQGEARRVCSANCGFVHYDNPTPVVAAVVEHDGMVVLVKEELDLDGEAPTLIGVYAFEQMNQVIIAYHVPARGTITLNEELDDYRHVPLRECKTWSSGTGLALRDWLRTRGIEPPMWEIPRTTA
ncbi:MAG: zinc ribbon domain-containing protein [Steroidobacteraceae bacterium]